MRKIIFGVILTLIVLLLFKYFDNKRKDNTVLQEHSALIQKQINNVGKLIVSEGHFSEVFNYKNSKATFGDFFTSNKKALIVVNANVTIAYDLSKIEFDLDKTNKVLSILHIPEEEIKIHPDLEYYDMQSDFFNPFEAKDYNEIKKRINASLNKKIEASEFKKNAKNRLISELSKFYILTNSLGWTLNYKGSTINENDDFSAIKL